MRMHELQSRPYGQPGGHPIVFPQKTDGLPQATLELFQRRSAGVFGHAPACFSTGPEPNNVADIAPEHVSGPCVECRRTLAGEVVPLVNTGNAAEFCRLMCKQLV